MKTIEPRNLLPVCAYPTTLALILGFAASPVWANPITGDFTVVDGAIRIKDETPVVPDQFEFRLGENLFGESRIDFWNDNRGEWVWSFGTTPTDVMSLDSSNKLSLYDLGALSENPAIVLNPGDPDAVPAITPYITIGDSEVLTIANSPTLLGGDFVIRSSNNKGSDESFLMEGITGGSGLIPTEGAGTRMMWYAEKAAFRMGEVSGSEWDFVNLGNHSTATGFDTQASGDCSFAAGDHTSAYGSSSVAMGSWSTAYGFASVSLGGGYAYGDSSVVLGNGSADGYTAVALGNSWAGGDYSVALGQSNASGHMSTSAGEALASGDHSVAMGTYYTEAFDYGSVAIGEAATASGLGAVALGWGSANAMFSVALGGSSHAYGTGSVAIADGQADGTNSLSVGPTVSGAAFTTTIGMYNENRFTDSSWWYGDDQNSVFEVGIGSDDNNRANALTVLQDGSVEIGKDATDGSVPLQVKSDGTVVLAKRQGDISMGNYQ